MANIEELRKRFDKIALAQDGLIHKAEEAWEDYCRNPNGFVPKFWCSRFFPSNELFAFLQSEIEAAEKARTEAIIKEIEQRYKDSLGIGNNPLVEHLRSKLLNNPE